MLHDLQACHASEGFEGRFAAAQENRSRLSFEEEHTSRIKKELASIEGKFDGAQGGTGKQ
jgi:hypothetical protein